jgi:hypothetical protein
MLEQNRLETKFDRSIGRLSEYLAATDYFSRLIKSPNPHLLEKNPKDKAIEVS